MSDPHEIFPGEGEYDRAMTTGNGQQLWVVLRLFGYEDNDNLRETIYDFGRDKLNQLSEET
jgi:hypothetical protein